MRHKQRYRFRVKESSGSAIALSVTYTDLLIHNFWSLVNADLDTSQLLTTAEFHGLADFPLVIEWFANIDNPQTRCAY